MAVFNINVEKLVT